MISHILNFHIFDILHQKTIVTNSPQSGMRERVRDHDITYNEFIDAFLAFGIFKIRVDWKHHHFHSISDLEESKFQVAMNYNTSCSKKRLSSAMVILRMLFALEWFEVVTYNHKKLGFLII